VLFDYALLSLGHILQNYMTICRKKNKIWSHKKLSVSGGFWRFWI